MLSDNSTMEWSVVQLVAWYHKETWNERPTDYVGQVFSVSYWTCISEPNRQIIGSWSLIWSNRFTEFFMKALGCTLVVVLRTESRGKTLPIIDLSHFLFRVANSGYANRSKRAKLETSWVLLWILVEIASLNDSYNILIFYLLLHLQILAFIPINWRIRFVSFRTYVCDISSKCPLPRLKRSQRITWSILRFSSQT